MKLKPIFLFIISLLFHFNSEIMAQTIQDTVEYRERYGLRVGIDLSKPLRTFLQEDYQGFEILGDYRIYEDYYLAAEIGNEQIPFNGDNLQVISRGSYIKLGADYNAYQNWAGMENLIIVGLRYGFATFNQTLEEYTIYTDTQFFPPNIIEDPVEFTGLNSSWLELVVGTKVELFQNLYLGATVQLKRRLFQKAPDNFDNIVIPGFNRTYDGSTFGVGYSYNISYLIPLYRKARN